MEFSANVVFIFPVPEEYVINFPGQILNMQNNVHAL